MQQKIAPKQEQSQKLSISLQKSMQILQMSQYELRIFAQDLLQRNPFVEDANLENVEIAKVANSELKAVKTYGTSKEAFLIENIASKKSLREHVIQSLNLLSLTPHEYFIANYLAENLEPNGYFLTPLSEIATSLQIDEKIIESLLIKLQNIDPPGLFARSISECLKLQIIANNDEKHKDKLLKLANNLELIAQGELTKIANKCNISIDEVPTLIGKIKLLNPKPGNGFMVEETQYKTPDIILTFDDAGDAKLEINGQTLPNLRVSMDYFLIVKNSLKNSQEIEFAKNEINEAKHTIKSIEQRSATIIKIVAIIVQQQIEFFKKGVMYLRPLTLSRVAELTGFNESTISRATSKKYISAPNGIYELKYFFSSNLQTKRSSQENISSTKVKEIIKQLINQEGQNILSDDQIAMQLASFNISIARRTVAKYREAMSLPTSSVRKRQSKFV